MTLEAAEKLPISQRPLGVAGQLGLELGQVDAGRRRPRRSATTSATDSRQGSSLEWCSYGPTNTTGRGPGARLAPAGSRSSSMPTSLSTAAVAPDPQKITRSWSVPPTAWWMTWRACSRSRVVWRPVPELSVWVLAYRGSTWSRMASSTKPSARPDAV